MTIIGHKSRKIIDIDYFCQQTEEERRQYAQTFEETDHNILQYLGIKRELMDQSVEFYLSKGDPEIQTLIEIIGTGNK